MRTAKRWTNDTFTRRVDHDAGRHRGPAAVTNRVCKRCGALYAKRRWTMPGRSAGPRVQEIAAPRLTVCPACQMIAAGQFSGEVRVSGAFAIGHGRVRYHFSHENKFAHVMWSREP